MEAFEAELHEAKATSSKAADGDEEEGADGDDAPRGEDIDIDGDIGDDVFAAGEAPVGLESGSEAWLKSDRDYTYPEVLVLHSYEAWGDADGTHSSFLHVSSHIYMPPTPPSSTPVERGTLSHLLHSLVKVTKRRSSQTSPISAVVCIVNRSMSSSSCSPRWVPLAPSTALPAW